MSFCGIAPRSTALRLFSAMLLAIQLLAANAEAAAEKLQADLVSLGLRARNDSPIPVDVRFKWESTRILEGQMEIELRDGERVLVRYRSGDLALTGGEQTFHLLLPPSPAPYSDSQVEARMKFATSNQVFDLGASSVFLPPGKERSLVVGWCDSRAGSALQVSAVGQSMMFERFAPMSPEPARKMLLTSMIRTTPEDLPAQPLAYNSFDMVVLTADAFAEAHEGQLQALLRWVKGGGSVCVFVAGGIQAHQLAFLNQLNEVDSSNPTYQAYGDGNIIPGAKKLSCVRPGLGRGVVVTGRVGTDIVLESPEWRKAVAFLWKFREHEMQLVAESGHWESGTNDPTAELPTTMNQYEQAVREQPNPYAVRRRQPGGRMRGGNPYMTPYFDSEESGLTSELMDPLMPETVRLIPFPALLGTLVLFLLMIGPADYFVLGWFRRRRYTWLLFPATSIGFVVVTVLMANHYLGLRDQRRSLIVVDLDKDGSAVRWNQYELIFAARNKQAVTEIKDALWVPLTSGEMMGMSPAVQSPISSYNIPQFTGGYQPNMRAGYSVYPPEPGGAPTYEGVVPVHFHTSQTIRQWEPELNRIFSFEPPAVPLIKNWLEIENAWPDLPKIRSKLSTGKLFSGDVCAIVGSNSVAFHAAASSGVAARDDSGQVASPYRTLTPDASLFYQVVFDLGSSEILPPSILSGMCLGGSSGIRALISQISPTGGENFEDMPAIDSEAGDSALVILTKEGDDIIAYRRFFHGN